MSALQELMNYTFISKYSRWLKEENRRETWKESVDRVKNMMLRRYPQISEEIEWSYDFMHQKKVLGSQRALQFGGEPIEKKHARIYNCTASYCDRLRFFQETLYLLLCGSGVGYSVQLHHIDKLPNLNLNLNKEEKEYIIPDTIEGWADSLGILLSSYFENPVFSEYYNKRVKFNFGQIREKGSYLSSGSGKAPGPEPLKIALEKIEKILVDCINNEQIRLKPINAHDIVCHSADAVLSGGVRRSSCISLFSYEDKEMMMCKTGNWHVHDKQRARSNNSVVLLRDECTFEQFKEIIQYTIEYGEPGFVFADSTEGVLNPCAEIGLYATDENGQSGFQGCNLSTINCGNIKTEEDFYDRCRAASIIGTCQAGFTDFPYLGSVTEYIFRRESLLGVSMTGILENPDISTDPKIQRKAAKLIKQVNKEIAEKIGINPAARTTCVKPEGTASCLLGTSSGIHPHHAKRYIRRVQTNTLERPYRFFKQFNKQSCEKSVWSANDTDECILFPVEVQDGAKLRNQTPALELLKIVKDTQINWVNEGKDDSLCVQSWLSHNVSNTITVGKDEWDDVIKYLFQNKKHFTAVSLLSDSGDKDYSQAPFTSVYTSREIVKEYGDASLWCSGIIEKGIEAFGDLWKACDTLLYEAAKNENLLDSEFEKIQKEVNQISAKSINKVDIVYDKMFKIKAKIGWITRARIFAMKFFENDLRKMTYCLKDVYNWKLYCDLQRDFNKVDYSNMVEFDDVTNFEGEAACSGGACLT